MSMCCYMITIVWLEIAWSAPTPPLISLAHTASCTPSTRLLALTVDSWHRITTPPINLSRCPTVSTGLLSTTLAWRPLSHQPPTLPYPNHWTPINYSSMTPWPSALRKLPSPTAPRERCPCCLGHHHRHVATTNPNPLIHLSVIEISHETMIFGPRWLFFVSRSVNRRSCVSEFALGKIYIPS